MRTQAGTSRRKCPAGSADRRTRPIQTGHDHRDHPLLHHRCVVASLRETNLNPETPPTDLITSGGGRHRLGLNRLGHGHGRWRPHRTARRLIPCLWQGSGESLHFEVWGEFAVRQALRVPTLGRKPIPSGILICTTTSSGFTLAGCPEIPIKSTIRKASPKVSVPLK